MLLSYKRYNKEVDYHMNIIDVKHYNKNIFSRPEHSIIFSSSEYVASFIMLVDNSNYNINIEVCEKYPFKPPKVFINNISYFKFLNETSIFFKKNNILDLCCLCCYSIITNWNPGYGFSAILNEINKYIIKRQKIINNILAKKIMKKKLGYIIPSLIDFL